MIGMSHETRGSQHHTRDYNYQDWRVIRRDEVQKKAAQRLSIFMVHMTLVNFVIG